MIDKGQCGVLSASGPSASCCLILCGSAHVCACGLSSKLATCPVQRRAAQRTVRLSLSSRRLEQLDRIAVRIFHLNLVAARTGFHLIAKAHSLALELANTCRQILH